MGRTRSAIAFAGALFVLAATAWLVAGGERDARRAAERAAVEPAGAAGDARLDLADAPAVATEPGARAAAWSPVDSATTAADPAPPVPGATLSGRVVTREGRPVAGARVAALALGPEAFFHAGDRAPRDWAAPLVGGEALDAWADAVWGESGADGRFALHGVAPGAVALAVRAAGFAPLDRPWLGVPEGGVDVGELVLAIGVRVEGHVVDAAGAPVAGARVALRLDDVLAGRQPTRRFAPAGASGPDGSFALDGVRPGEFELEATTDALGAGTFEGTVEHGTLHDVVIALPPPRRIAGRVVLPAGIEVPPLVVRAEPDARRRGRDIQESERRTAVPDADGAFAFDALPDFDAWGVWVRLDGAFERDAVARLASASAQAGDEDVVLEIGPPVEVRVRALDAASGAPVATLEITTLRATTPGPARRIDGVHVADVWLGAPARTMKFSLRLDATGYHEHFVVAQQSGDSIDLGEVRLRPQAQLELRVVDASSDAPIAGARVGLVHERGRRFARSAADGPLLPDSTGATTDADGRARLVRVEERAAVVWVEADGYGRFEQRLAESAGEPLDVRLQPPAHARVLVVAGGQPQAGVVVRVERVVEVDDIQPDREDEQRLVVTDASGEAAVRAVLGARYTWSVPLAHDGRRTLVTGTATFARDGDTWRIDLTDLATLAGRITRHGEPLVGARVVAFRGQQWNDWLGEATTTTDGTYELGPLPAAELVGVVEHRALVFATDWHLEVVPGRNALDIDVAPTVLFGELVDDRGTAIAGHELHLSAPSAPSAHPWNRSSRRVGPVTTDARGRFRFDDLAPSTPLTLQIARESHAMPVAFVLEPGEIRDAGRIVAPRAARVDVRFPRDAPRSVGDMVVVVVQHAGGERRVIANRGGDARVTGLPPGRCTIRIHAVDGKPIAVHDGVELQPARTTDLVVGDS